MLSILRSNLTVFLPSVIHSLSMWFIILHPYFWRGPLSNCLNIYALNYAIIFKNNSFIPSHFITGEAIDLGDFEFEALVLPLE